MSYTGGGGAGNPGGAGTASGCQGENGTGGLLVVFADTFTNKSTISSNGSKGGNGYCPGGASGGGSINIFYNKLKSTGQIAATGGAAGINIPSGGYAGQVGAVGGNGTVTLNKVQPTLNYIEKNLILDIEDEYVVEKNDITYVSNGVQSKLLTVGELNFEILDTNVAEVDENGKITAKMPGKTKVKVTDITNDIYTYIFLEVVNGVKFDVQEGKYFTVALKENGTVWSYGTNENGELGLADNENRNKPTKIEELESIKAISAGYSHSLALTEQGEVYAWGYGEKGQLGDGNEQNSNVPVKVDGITNIKEISCYKNISIAISYDGTVYVWGEGYSSLPMRLIFQEKAAHISKAIILTQNGRVYDIRTDLVPIEGLTDISKVASGENHVVALNPEGITYAYGTNKYGECRKYSCWKFTCYRKIL